MNVSSAVQAVGRSVTQMDAVAARMAAGPEAADLADDVTKMMIAEKGVEIATEILKTQNDMLGAVIDMIV